MSALCAVKLLHNLKKNNADISFARFAEFIDSLHSGKKLRKSIDLEFIDQIFDFKFARNDFDLFVSSDLKEIKLTICRDLCSWQYCIVTRDSTGFKVVRHSLPEKKDLNQSFRDLETIANVFDECISNLEKCFAEMAEIDECFCILDPVNPTAKDNFRRVTISDAVSAIIILDSWSSSVTVPRIKLVGPKKSRERFEELLQDKLPDWNGEEGIAANLLDIFGEGIHVDALGLRRGQDIQTTQVSAEECSICLCDEPPALPLCENNKCKMMFHQACLYQWLIAAEPSVQWGNAAGKCPNCLMAITCPKPT